MAGPDDGGVYGLGRHLLGYLQVPFLERGRDVFGSSGGRGEAGTDTYKRVYMDECLPQPVLLGRLST